MSATGITVVVTAKTDFGRWGLDSTTKLTDDAKALLSNPRKFEQDCGSRYVAIENRGASVSIVLVVSDVTSDVKGRFEADVGGSVGAGGPLGAKASATLSVELRRASKQNRTDVKVFATGGQGLGSLKDVVAGLLDKDNNLQEIGKALSEFLKGFNDTNAAATSYIVASMEQFSWDASQLDLWTDYTENKLRDVVI